MSLGGLFQDKTRLELIHDSGDQTTSHTSGDQVAFIHTPLVQIDPTKYRGYYKVVDLTLTTSAVATTVSASNAVIIIGTVIWAKQYALSGSMIYHVGYSQRFTNQEWKSQMVLTQQSREWFGPIQTYDTDGANNDPIGFAFSVPGDSNGYGYGSYALSQLMVRSYYTYGGQSTWKIPTIQFRLKLYGIPL